MEPVNNGVASFAIAADGVEAAVAPRSDAGAEPPAPSVPLVEPRNGGLGRNGRRVVASGGDWTGTLEPIRLRAS